MTNKIDLIDESDRGAVIVGAAILESDLENLLRPIFNSNRVPKKHLVRMFDVNGPLSSFSAKVLICRGFGLISEEIFSDLEAIRKLRNQFAHTADEVDFLSTDIQRIVFGLRCTQDALKRLATKRYSPKQEESIPDWEMRSRGFVKHAKSVFCIGVHALRVEILKHTMRDVNSEAQHGAMGKER